MENCGFPRGTDRSFRGMRAGCLNVTTAQHGTFWDIWRVIACPAIPFQLQYPAGVAGRSDWAGTEAEVFHRRESFFLDRLTDDRYHTND